MWYDQCPYWGEYQPSTSAISNHEQSSVNLSRFKKILKLGEYQQWFGLCIYKSSYENPTVILNVCIVGALGKKCSTKIPDHIYDKVPQPN